MGHLALYVLSSHVFVDHWCVIYIHFYKFWTNLVYFSFCLLLTHLFRYDWQQPMATTTTPRTTAVSNCLWGGNRCPSKMVRWWQHHHQVKWNDNATTRWWEMMGSWNDGGWGGNKFRGGKAKDKRPKRHCLTSLGPLVSFYLFSFHVFVAKFL